MHEYTWSVQVGEVTVVGFTPSESARSRCASASQTMRADFDGFSPAGRAVTVSTVDDVGGCVALDDDPQAASVNAPTTMVAVTTRPLR